jgi:hypothetical protein
MTAPTPAVEPAEGAQATTNLLADLTAGGESGSSAGDVLPASPRRSLSFQTLVVVLVLAASGGVLYLMRKQGMQSGFKFQPLPVEKELAKVRTRAAADEQRILGELARSTLESLPNEDIQKNPFQLEGHSATQAADPSAGLADRQRQEHERRQAEILGRLAALNLTSVMDGPNPVAYISGTLVRVGDIIEESFTVAQIRDRSVDLLADGKIYTLHLSEGTAPGRPHPRPGPINPR